MASRLLSSSVVPPSLKFVHPATASRLFYNKANRNYENDDDENYRSIRPGSRIRRDSFLDIFYLFPPTRSLKEVMNFMDEFFQHPLISASQRFLSPRVRRGWIVEFHGRVLPTSFDMYLRIESTGLSKEEVKVALEHFRMMISEPGEEKKVYKTNEIKAEMKDAELTPMVPKIKFDLKNDTLWEVMSSIKKLREKN